MATAPTRSKLATKTAARMVAKEFEIKPRSPKEYAWLFAERVNDRFASAYRMIPYSDKAGSEFQRTYRLHVAAEGVVWAWRTCRLATEVEQWLSRMDRETYLQTLLDLADRADAIGWIPYILNSHPAILGELDAARIPAHIWEDYRRYWNA